MRPRQRAEAGSWLLATVKVIVAIPMRPGLSRHQFHTDEKGHHAALPLNGRLMCRHGTGIAGATISTPASSPILACLQSSELS
jgi:hypothetical protein